MPGLFWDTSALVKHYHPELGTPRVDSLLQTAGSQHVMSRLGVTETFSVFAGKARAGLITLAEFDQLCRRFLADTRRKVFSVARLSLPITKKRRGSCASMGLSLGRECALWTASNSP